MDYNNNDTSNFDEKCIRVNTFQTACFNSKKATIDFVCFSLFSIKYLFIYLLIYLFIYFSFIQKIQIATYLHLATQGGLQEH